MGRAHPRPCILTPFMTLGERSEKSAHEPGWSLRRHDTRSRARFHRHPGAKTLREIAAALNGRGIATARGGKWEATTVRKNGWAWLALTGIKANIPFIRLGVAKLGSGGFGHAHARATALLGIRIWTLATSAWGVRLLLRGTSLVEAKPA